MDSPFTLLIGVCTFFAVASPFILITIRAAVKYQRQEIITDLAEVFDVDSKTSVRLIPSFEFVKYKYFVGSQRSRVGDLVRKNRAPGLNDYVTRSRYRQDFALRYWLIGCSPFSAVVGFLTFLSLDFLFTLAFNGTGITLGAEPVSWPKSDSFGTIWLLALCAAFGGSFLTALRSLYRAVKNFDLSPGTVVNETLKIVLATAMAPVITIALLSVVGKTLNAAFPSHVSEQPSVVIAAIIAACFVAGTMPEVALRRIVQRDPMKNYKQEDDLVFQAFKVTPPEIIDGIDSEIRVRLNDHHIHSVQNLAAANPLMLFVETPYGVYQIMDWVAQAQLCCSVGREKLVRLWSFGIRTLFDLERLASRKDVASEMLLIEIGRVMLGTGLVPPEITDRAATAALVRSSIALRLDDPHVQRLRQIYIAVSDRLGSGSKRFRKGRYRIFWRMQGWRWKTANGA